MAAPPPATDPVAAAGLRQLRASARAPRMRLPVYFPATQRPLLPLERRVCTPSDAEDEERLASLVRFGPRMVAASTHPGFLPHAMPRAAGPGLGAGCAAVGVMARVSRHTRPASFVLCGVQRLVIDDFLETTADARLVRDAPAPGGGDADDGEEISAAEALSFALAVRAGLSAPECHAMLLTSSTSARLEWLARRGHGAARTSLLPCSDAPR